MATLTSPQSEASIESTSSSNGDERLFGCEIISSDGRCGCAKSHTRGKQFITKEVCV